jgi:uncharacterized protein YacL
VGLLDISTTQAFQRAIMGSEVKPRRLEMKDVWIATAGFVLGWLLSKTWQDPGCRLGLAVFLVITAVMVLVFVLAVVGHGRPPNPPREEEDEGD